MAMIEARGLTKTYRSKSGPVHALNGLDLTVPEGTVKSRTHYALMNLRLALQEMGVSR